MSEASLQRQVFKFLAARSVYASQEVPFMSRVIDIAYLDGNDVVTVELKLRDWQKAIEQMLEHRIAADYSFLCMPDDVSDGVQNKICDELKRYGFGFSVWSRSEKRLEERLAPEKSTVTSNFAANRLRERLS